jgi:SAM-dependent methyltransferase
MKLNKVVPWGRTLAEYKLMFDLTETDLERKILGCGDGPASFNAEMKQQGHRVVSIDPVYEFSDEQIRQRVQDTYTTVISQLKLKPDSYVWTIFKTIEELGKARMGAMEDFLVDYELGKKEDRYRAESLPELSFGDRQFDLCLCSHLLFLYSDQFTLEFHLASIEELLRVSQELRIFPLLKLNCDRSPYVDPIMKALSEKGYNVSVESVPYEFQRGGNQMMKISRPD